MWRLLSHVSRKLIVILVTELAVSLLMSNYALMLISNNKLPLRCITQVCGSPAILSDICSVLLLLWPST